MNLEPIVRAAMKRGASDVHLEPGSPPIVRVRGDLQRQGEALTAADTRTIAESVLGPDHWQRFAQRGSFDLSRTIGGVRCRMNVFVSRAGIALAIRLLTRRVPTLETLNLHPDLGQLVNRRHGLVLISGPTGSGKSSTLAALIQAINLTSQRHIVTVEEPIEFAMQSRLGFIQQREVGTHTPSFEQALLDVLREDPDVVMVGEMREPEVMQLTLSIAETGHLVLATMHASNTSEAVQRVVTSFSPDHQPAIRAALADALIGVVSQRLFHVRERNLLVPECEVLIATSPVRNQIRQGEFHKLPSALMTGAKDGMFTWERYKAWMDSRVSWHVASEEGLEAIDERPTVVEPSIHVGPPPARPIRPAAEDDEVIALEPPSEAIAEFVSRLRPPAK